MKKFYQNKKVLVTGHTGFKGSWLTCWLLEMGAEVCGFSLTVPTETNHWELLGLEKRISDYRGDITRDDLLEEIILKERPEIVFHLAAQPLVKESYADPLYTFKTNVIGTASIMDVVRRNPGVVKSFVVITSDKAYENLEWIYGYKESDLMGGEDPYSASKGAAEIACSSYYRCFFSKSETNFATVRAGNVIGGGDWAENRIVPDIFKSWDAQKDVQLRNPQSTRPWQHVLEPLSGYLQLGLHLYINDDLDGESFNFGPGANTVATVGELVDEFKLSLQSDFGWIKTHTLHMKEANLLKLNCEKAQHYLKWAQVLNFKETVGFTGKWYQKYYRNDDMLSVTINQIHQYTELAQQRELYWTKL
jgi:CDP-glucose 4,6-dehydratase